jgi:hypothetical protein
MKATIHKDTIYEIENFLSEQEQSELLYIINNITNDWNNGSNDYWKGKNASVTGPAIQNIDSRVKKLFSSYSHINSVHSINRFKPGDDMGKHADEVGHKEIKFGIVIYINDDFNGGEICYPELNIIHKPKARSLIIHPGNAIHYVNKVLDGPVRYAMTTFVHGTDEKPAILEEL